MRSLTSRPSSDSPKTSQDDVELVSMPSPSTPGTSSTSGSPISSNATLSSQETPSTSRSLSVVERRGVTGLTLIALLPLPPICSLYIKGIGNKVTQKAHSLRAKADALSQDFINARQEAWEKYRQEQQAKQQQRRVSSSPNPRESNNPPQPSLSPGESNNLPQPSPLPSSLPQPVRTDDPSGLENFSPEVQDLLREIGCTHFDATYSYVDHLYDYWPKTRIRHRDGMVQKITSIEFNLIKKVVECFQKYPVEFVQLFNLGDLHILFRYSDGPLEFQDKNVSGLQQIVLKCFQEHPEQLLPFFDPVLSLENTDVRFHPTIHRNVNTLLSFQQNPQRFITWLLSTDDFEKRLADLAYALKQQPTLAQPLLDFFRQNPRQILDIMYHPPTRNFWIEQGLVRFFQLLPGLADILESLFQPENFSEAVAAFLRPADLRTHFENIDIIRALFPTSLYPKLIQFFQNHPEKFQQLIIDYKDLQEAIGVDGDLRFAVILAVATKISVLENFPTSEGLALWTLSTYFSVNAGGRYMTLDYSARAKHGEILAAIERDPESTETCALVFQQACQTHLTQLSTRMMQEIISAKDSNQQCECAENGFSLYFWTLMTTWKMCEERLVDDVATIVMDYAADYGSSRKTEDFFTVSYLFLMEVWKGVHQYLPVMGVSSLIREYVYCDRNSVFFTTHHQALTRMVEAQENLSGNSQPTEPSPSASPGS